LNEESPNIRPEATRSNARLSRALGQHSMSIRSIGVAVCCISFLFGCCRAPQGTVHVQQLDTWVGSHSILFEETSRYAPLVISHDPISTDDDANLVIRGQMTTVTVSESSIVINGTSHHLDEGDKVYIVDGILSTNQIESGIESPNQRMVPTD
jgi:hypothetical protein